MSKAMTAPAKKAAAKKASAQEAKKAAVSKNGAGKSSEIVTMPVTMQGQRYQIRATKFLVLKVMKGSAVITDWAEERDGDDDKLSTSELIELSDNYENLVMLFDARDGSVGAGGKDARKSSRERVMDGLNEGLLDFDDFELAFKQLSGVIEKPGGRPLG